MVRNYRGIAALWLALCLLGAAGQSCAETILVGDLGLPVETAWQRASSEEEQSVGSIILRQPEAGSTLEVYFPIRQVQLKTDLDDFFNRLDQGWQRRYGDQAIMTWQEIGDVRWRVCHRPSQDNQEEVYELVTVHGGKAYQAMIMAAAGTTSLPESVLALLKGASWAETPNAVAPAPEKIRPVEETVPEKVDPPVVPEPDVPASSVAAEPGKPWHLLKQVVVSPERSHWTQIASEEKPHFGVGGAVSGLGLEAGDDSLDWFLEGRLARTGEAGIEMSSFRVHWQVDWKPLPNVWREGETVVTGLTFRDKSEASSIDRQFGIRYELSAVCMKRKEMVTWLNHLKRGGAALMGKIPALAGDCLTQPETVPAVTVMATSGAPAPEKAVLTLPPAWAESIQPKQTGEVSRVLLVMRFFASQAGTSPGDALLGQAAVIFVFGPDS